MKNEIISGLMVVLLVTIICACIQSKILNNRAKQAAELRRQHERQVDRKVKLTRGKRFDCPACGSLEACAKCPRK